MSTDLTLLVLCSPIVILLVFISVELWAAALFSAKQELSTPGPYRPSALILIPAHNEALVIEKCIASLKSQLGKKDCVVVVADRCTDDTAGSARSAGVEVVVRESGRKTGKGAALNYGLARTGHIKTDVIVVIDADCVVESEALSLLAWLAYSKKRPIQAAYVIERNPVDKSSRMRVAELSIFVKNLLRPAGLSRFGMPSLLTGSGMAWPRDQLEPGSFSFESLVEDMEIGLEATLSNRPPLFCEHAEVRSYFPTESVSASTQRERWVHGHWHSIRLFVPRLLIHFLQSPKLSTLVVLLELVVPPLSILLTVWLVAVLIPILIVPPGSNLLSIYCLVIAGAMGASGLIASLWRYRKMYLLTQAAGRVPAYLWNQACVCWKLVAKGREREWIKTKRG